MANGQKVLVDGALEGVVQKQAKDIIGQLWVWVLLQSGKIQIAPADFVRPT